jgi:peptidyl-prolyl cis-trans isomerase B (cyclophilin B)
MQQSLKSWLIISAVFMSLLFTGCSSPQAGTDTSGEVANSGEAVPERVAVRPQLENLPRLEGQATVELMVKGEPIVIQVDGTNAPITAGNFVDLVERGFYDGLAFHRVVREPDPFVIQGGDPQSKDPNFPPQQLGTGGYVDPDTSEARLIPLEIKPEGMDEPVYGQTLADSQINAAPVLPHRQGAVAMARSQLPNSASSQFYITLADVPFLDGSYAVFGYVTSGMDVVDAVQQGDTIESARVIEGAENLKNSSANAASTEAGEAETE